MLLTQAPLHPYRSLKNHEIVHTTDVVEDILSGRLEPVKGTYYDFLVGQKASEARKLPGVFDVVRET